MKDANSLSLKEETQQATRLPVRYLQAQSVCLDPKYKSGSRLGKELLQDGDLFASPGGLYLYRVVGGPVCLLYDREQLPWPSCSLDWRGKQPSWRRIGKRLIPDIAGKNCACYRVEIVGHEDEVVVKVLSWVELDPALKRWWYSIEMPATEKAFWATQVEPELAAEASAQSD